MSISPVASEVTASTTSVRHGFSVLRMPIPARMKASFDEVRPTLRPTSKLVEAIDYRRRRHRRPGSPAARSLGGRPS